MPELPEVEIIKRQLSKEIVGWQITNVWTDTPKQLKPSPAEFKKTVVGKKIRGVSRRAKLLLFELEELSDGSGECYLAVHLKLTGRLLVREVAYPADDYVHVILRLEGGRLKSSLELRFSDARKFGFMQLLKDQQELQKNLASYGPEPLHDLTLPKFQQILAATSRKIKLVLMDQPKIAGIGNIYANDALWLAKIHPERKANSLNVQESHQLFDSIEKVLKEGLQEGGASDQWYRQVHGEKGSYQKHFKVYARAGEPCLRHPGQEILYAKVGQRGTFYCPECQKL